MLCLIFTAYAV